MSMGLPQFPVKAPAASCWGHWSLAGVGTLGTGWWHMGVSAHPARELLAAPAGPWLGLRVDFGNSCCSRALPTGPVGGRALGLLALPCSPGDGLCPSAHTSRALLCSPAPFLLKKTQEGDSASLQAQQEPSVRGVCCVQDGAWV